MKLIAIFLLISVSSYAACEDYTRFGQTQKICWRNELRAFTNEKCAGDCLAKSFIKKNLSTPNLSLSGGKNPASAKCEYHGIRVVVLKDPRGGEQSFCEFADGSLMDSNAVARSLR